jgi:hypothetical protein
VKPKNKNSHKQQGKNSNGERFKNICIGIGAIGGMVYPYLQELIQYFLG